MFHIHLTIADNKIRTVKDALIKKNGDKYTWAEVLVLGLNDITKKIKRKEKNG